MKVHLAQCLCPARHCIMGFAFIPGAPFHGLPEGMVLTIENAPDMLMAFVVYAVKEKNLINPWCGICHSPITEWHCEVAPTRFDTLAEAAPELARLQEANRATNEFFKAAKN